MAILKTWGVCDDAFFPEIPDVCVGGDRGGFVYVVENKPISAGYTKTGAYVGEGRKLDA